MDAHMISIAALVIAALVIAVAAVGFAVYQSKLTVTEGVKAVPSLVTEVNSAAAVVINSYEQARRNGRLEHPPALSEVRAKVRAWLPEWAKTDATDEQIVEAINAAILTASALSNHIAANKAIAADTPVSPLPREFAGHEHAPRALHSSFTTQLP